MAANAPTSGKQPMASMAPATDGNPNICARCRGGSVPIPVNAAISAPATVTPRSKRVARIRYKLSSIPLTLPASANAAQENCSRSEEHTSELQPLMRISYAVLCLKTKLTQYNDTTHSQVEQTQY